MTGGDRLAQLLKDWRNEAKEMTGQSSGGSFMVLASMEAEYETLVKCADQLEAALRAAGEARPPADAKEWICPKCGGDALWCKCAAGEPPPQEGTDMPEANGESMVNRLLRENDLLTKHCESWSRDYKALAEKLDAADREVEQLRAAGEPPPTFCRHCGASIPHRTGEGRCEHCAHHSTEITPRPWERAAGDAGGWQAIETAPKDRRTVLLHSADGVQTGWRASHGKWLTETGWVEPTHWQPMPQPPAIQP